MDLKVAPNPVQLSLRMVTNHIKSKQGQGDLVVTLRVGMPLIATIVEVRVTLHHMTFITIWSLYISQKVLARKRTISNGSLKSPSNSREEVRS